MTTLAPASLQWLAAAWADAIGSAQISGIVGDAAHRATGGYHISREDLIAAGMGGDYSIAQVADDRLGLSNLASALDMTMSTADMRLVTGRLVASAKDADDERLNRAREVIGTLDGKTVVGVDTQLAPSTVVPGYGDSSHLWHVHISVVRRWAADWDAARAIYSIVIGMPVADWRAAGGWAWDGGDVALTSDDLKQVRKAAALGLYDALWVAANRKPFGGLTYEGPGSVGAAIEANFGALASAPLAPKVDTIEAGVTALAERPAGTVVLTEADRAAIATAIGDDLGVRLAHLEAAVAQLAAALTAGAQAELTRLTAPGA